jgi:hypothetical protein
VNRFEYNGINTAINCGAIRRQGRAGKCLKWVGLYVWLREMESINPGYLYRSLDCDGRGRKEATD